MTILFQQLEITGLTLSFKCPVFGLPILLSKERLQRWFLLGGKASRDALFLSRWDFSFLVPPLSGSVPFSYIRPFAHASRFSFHRPSSINKGWISRVGSLFFSFLYLRLRVPRVGSLPCLVDITVVVHLLWSLLHSLLSFARLLLLIGGGHCFQSCLGRFYRDRPSL